MSWNIYCQSGKHSLKCHAPRERVSWNNRIIGIKIFKFCHAPRERVSWNYCIYSITYNNLGSRSTWACELKCRKNNKWTVYDRSRSTWACELKCFHLMVTWYLVCSHAPRERVSWNTPYIVATWQLFLSRSTWACELKFDNEVIANGNITVTLHVSVWVEILILPIAYLKKSVTLHVSVWVEIMR